MTTTHTPAPGTASTVVIDDATCLACGCLCDDINLRVEQGRIVAAENACARGRDWFLADPAAECLPAALALINGQPSTPAAALDAAAAILSQARQPVVLGLTHTTSEAVAAAISVADRIGAVVDVGMVEARVNDHAAFQRVGRVGATLGEVKNRADVIIYWGVDPLTTHPRHLERYSLEPVGRFVPEGRAGRTLIIVDNDVAASATAARADLFVPIRPDAQLATLDTLRALAAGRGRALDPGRVERATGLSLETLQELVEHLERARYGAFFHGPGLSRAGSVCVEMALGLVRDLNRNVGRRFVILPMGEPGNVAGAEAVLAWQTGFAPSVDLSGDSPRRSASRRRPSDSSNAARRTRR